MTHNSHFTNIKQINSFLFYFKELKFPPPGMEEAARASHWRWFKLLDEALKDEVTESNYRSVASSLSDDDCGPQASKRICQVKVGGDILELLVDDEVISGVTNSAALSQERLMDDETPAQLSTLDVEKVKLNRERHLLEKEHAELDRERLVMEREKDLAEREKIALQRDRAQVEKDRAAVDRDRAALDQDRAQLEKDRAALERDKAALVRDREKQNVSLKEKNSPLDTPHEKNREKLILLIERLIDKF